MPKERKDRSASTENLRACPYQCSTRHSKQSLNKKNPSENDKPLQEYEDARCPVCMEHPHNAILLLCSSHDKGCRPYMCDTSYRHSNCFDQFKKSNSTSLTEESQPSKSKLACPLCRGEVNGTVVVDAARSFMNKKSRSCASETCEFSGTYADLRKHARNVHPFLRPSEADPERERDWSRMQRQRDIEDLLSTIRSAFGVDRDEDTISDLSFNGAGSGLTVVLQFILVRSEQSSRSSSLSGDSPARAEVTNGRRSRDPLFGEIYDDEDESSDGVESGAGPHSSN